MSEAFELQKVIAALFNAHLNEFITKFGQRKSSMTIQTGGLKEIRVRTQDNLLRFADRMYFLREELNSRSADKSLDLDSFLSLLDPLLYFYLNTNYLLEYGFLSLQDSIAVETHLMPRLQGFFDDVDKHLGFNHFSSKIAMTRAEIPELTVRIKNWFGFPISNIKVSLFYNMLSGSGKASDSFALSKQSDESGEVKLRLMKGSCAIHIPRYNVNAVVDVSASKTKELRVLDIGRLMTSLFAALRKQ